MRKKLTALKLARLERGLSQYDVQAQTGIPQVYVSLYERELPSPSEQHKYALAKLYQKPQRELWN